MIILYSAPALLLSSSSSENLLQVPVSRLKSYGDCAFSAAAPIWGIGCRQILEMGYRVFTDIIWDIIILPIIFAAPLNGWLLLIRALY